MSTDDLTDTNKLALNKLVHEEAMEIVESHFLYASAVGILPLPLIDLAAITAIQMRMISRITKEYGQDYSKHWGKSILTSLLGSATATTASFGILGSWVKTIPGIGSLLGIATLPVVAGSITYAVGATFVAYYERGGQFIDFDPEAERGKMVQAFLDRLKSKKPEKEDDDDKQNTNDALQGEIAELSKALAGLTELVNTRLPKAKS